MPWLSLTPGFSRVAEAFRGASRFNGLPARGKPLKRLWSAVRAITGLKPGVNGIAMLICARFNKRTVLFCCATPPLWLETVLEAGINEMGVVIEVPSRRGIHVMAVGVFQVPPQIFADAPGERRSDAVFLRAGAERHAVDRRLIIVGAIVKIAKVQVGLFVQHKTGIEIDRPVIVLRIENGLGVIGGWRLRLADDVIESGLQAKPVQRRPARGLAEIVGAPPE